MARCLEEITQNHAIQLPARWGKVCLGNLTGGRLGSGPPPPGFVDVRIDRQSALGNPFRMGVDGRDERLRNAVCDACAEAFEDPRQEGVRAIAAMRGLAVDARFGGDFARRSRHEALNALEGRLRAGEALRLMCWCAPKRCHGEAIAQMLVSRVETAVYIKPPL